MLIDTHEKRKGPWSPIKNRQTQPYYRSREASQDYDGYWGKVKDPDGIERDRLSTREHDDFVSDTVREAMWIHKRINKTSAVLDIGCGPGWFGEGITGRWHGTELNTAASKDATLSGYTMTPPDLREHKPAFYDCIVMHHVIEHMPDPISEIQDVRRILKTGGWLILGTPDFGSPCANRFLDKYRLLHDSTHCSLFTNESMHRFLRDHSFTIHDVEYPFPARYATAENMQRWADGPEAGISPPWPGNFMTFYCQR